MEHAEKKKGIPKGKLHSFSSYLEGLLNVTVRVQRLSDTSRLPQQETEPGFAYTSEKRLFLLSQLFLLILKSHYSKSLSLNMSFLCILKMYSLATVQ